MFATVLLGKWSTENCCHKNNNRRFYVRPHHRVSNLWLMTLFCVVVDIVPVPTAFSTSSILPLSFTQAFEHIRINKIKKLLKIKNDNINIIMFHEVYNFANFAFYLLRTINIRALKLNPLLPFLYNYFFIFIYWIHSFVFIMTLSDPIIPFTIICKDSIVKYISNFRQICLVCWISIWTYFVVRRILRIVGFCESEYIDPFN